MVVSVRLVFAIRLLRLMAVDGTRAIKIKDSLYSLCFTTILDVPIMPKRALLDKSAERLREEVASG